jgi:hypothetical protein
VLKFLAAQPDTWLTTSDEIAKHYQRTLEERGSPPHRSFGARKPAPNAHEA